MSLWQRTMVLKPQGDNTVPMGHTFSQHSFNCSLVKEHPADKQQNHVKIYFINRQTGNYKLIFQSVNIIKYFFIWPCFDRRKHPTIHSRSIALKCENITTKIGFVKSGIKKRKKLAQNYKLRQYNKIQCNLACIHKKIKIEKLLRFQRQQRGELDRDKYIS